MRRPTMTDVARQAGVGVATVDRVINKRAPVKPETAHKVLAAAKALGFRASRLIQQRVDEFVPAQRLGFLLHRKSSVFYTELAAELTAATQRCDDIAGTAVVEYAEDMSPASIVAGIYALAEKADAIAVVSSDHQHVSDCIEHLADKGVPVIALITDLSAQRKRGFVGIDHRVAGRTAAWAMCQFSPQPRSVGLVMASHRILSQEYSESSFRSYCREHAESINIIDCVISLENNTMAQQTVSTLLQEQPSITGLYCIGGGIGGVVQALRQAKPKSLFVICNELTDITRAALIDHTIDLVIANPRRALAEKTVTAMVNALQHPQQNTKAYEILAHELFISENIQ
ncbi:LacI family DNA-binding transcriptional regulator [Halioxenophilus aromaticivorans]|uniref:LacI family DNA-binding transcriptional regulator n=1 Tax=Halioxenophilus aromaticivorans TaxID=1306992 RepID=A0AAV3U442_9ALTE